MRPAICILSHYVVSVFLPPSFPCFLFLHLSSVFPFFLYPRPRHKLVRHGTRFGHLHGVLAGMQAGRGHLLTPFFLFTLSLWQRRSTGHSFPVSSSIWQHSGGRKAARGGGCKTLLVVVFGLGLDTTFLFWVFLFFSSFFFSSSFPKSLVTHPRCRVGLDGV
jgi:hypothetical protein